MDGPRTVHVRFRDVRNDAQGEAFPLLRPPDPGAFPVALDPGEMGAGVIRPVMDSPPSRDLIDEAGGDQGDEQGAPVPLPPTGALDHAGSTEPARALAGWRMGGAPAPEGDGVAPSEVIPFQEIG